MLIAAVFRRVSIQTVLGQLIPITDTPKIAVSIFKSNKSINNEVILIHTNKLTLHNHFVYENSLS